MRVHPVVLVGLVLAPFLVLAASIGLWVASEDVRAAVRVADTYLSEPVKVYPTSDALIGQMVDIANLETASLQLEQRLTGRRGSESSWEWMGEKMTFIARGEVSAGVDLQQLAPGDIVVTPEGIAVVQLPPAAILHVELDQEQSFVSDRQRGWFGWSDKDLETKVRAEAVLALEQAALREGILQRADASAQRTVRGLLLQAGVEEVSFRLGS